jgi:hypothetical protein
MTDDAVTDGYFATVQLCDAVLAKRLGTASWTAATTPNKIIAIQMATSAIDRLDYSGLKYLDTQARQFPRKYLLDPNETSPWGNIINVDNYNYTYESLTVPDSVLLACALEALALIEYYATITAAKRKTLQDQGVKSYSIGPLSETFGGSGSALIGDLKSAEAYGLLEKYIENSVLIT